MSQVQISGPNPLALPFCFPGSVPEALGMPWRNTPTTDKQIARTKLSGIGRSSRNSLSPSAFQNLTLSSRASSHALPPCSQQGSPGMTSTYLPHAPLAATQAPRDIYMAAARPAVAGSPHSFDSEFPAENCYNGIYNACSAPVEQPATNETSNHFQYQVPTTTYEQPYYNFPPRSNMMEYGTDNISGYAEENYSENPQVTMGQCSEPMAIRAGPLFDNAEFGLQQQQQRLSSESTHLTSRPSVPETQLHQSSHTPLGQSPLFGNVVSSEDYPRSTSSNPSLSPHPMELPASSLSSHYSPPLSSLPIISPSQSFDRPQFYPDGPPRDPNYSFPPTPTTPVPSMPLPVTSAGIQVRVVHSRTKPQCWDHGCNGREFSTFSNLLRHQREKAGLAAKSECPYCGTVFTRTTARNGHLSQGKCKVKRQMDEDQQMSGAPR